jgi:hypothetical protein
MRSIFFSVVGIQIICFAAFTSAKAQKEDSRPASQQAGFLLTARKPLPGPAIF